MGVALSSRTFWIALLLVGSLVLTGLLAARAHGAVSRHRALAEEVLRDYAALAADELLRRFTAEVGYYGFGYAVALLRREASGEPTDLPEREALRAAANERETQALELVGTAFILDPASGRLTVSGEPLPPGVERGLHAVRPEDLVADDAGFSSLLLGGSGGGQARAAAPGNRPGGGGGGGWPGADLGRRRGPRHPSGRP